MFSLRHGPRRAAAAAVAALALLLAYPGPAHAASGGLDTTFGSNGKVVTTDVQDSTLGHGLALQDDGKMIVPAFSLGSQFTLLRYNPDGSPDTGFGDGGQVDSNFEGTEGLAQATAVQPDGKIVVTGFTERTQGGCCWVTVARYLPDGSLDTDFGDGGHAYSETGTNGADNPRAITVQPDGRIVVAGTTAGDMGVSRFDPDGSPDTTFSGDGHVATHFSNLDFSNGEDVAVQPDGKIVVAGHAGLGSPFVTPAFALARYLPDGRLDTGFDHDGKRVVNFRTSAQGHGLALLPNGDMVVAGAADGGFALARLNSDGSLDTGFDGDGKEITRFAQNAGAHDVVAQADGKLVVAGFRGADFALARYNPDGTLDTGFDGDGKVITDFAPGDADAAADVAVQPDGRIVAAGRTADHPALARYLP